MRNTHRLGWVVGMCSLAIVVPAALAQRTVTVPAQLAHNADMVVYDGKVVTMDDPSMDPVPGKIVQAMAVRDGKILALGNDDDILLYATPKTLRVDLHGRTVIPGTIDPHTHMYGAVTYFNPALLLLRKSNDGHVTEEEIDRVTLMKMVTVWASEYVSQQDTLGTLERGKMADFLVLNKDYFTVPEEEIANIYPLMTVAEGKPVLWRAEFAAEQNHAPVGP